MEHIAILINSATRILMLKVVKYLTTLHHLNQCMVLSKYKNNNMKLLNQLYELYIGNCCIRIITNRVHLSAFDFIHAPK